MAPAKLVKKEETFEFEYSIENTSHKNFITNRIEYDDKSVVWFGYHTNWKRIDGVWHVLSTNQNAKPLEKYLPEIVYGDDRTIWTPCETPEYEKLYNEYYKNDFRDRKIDEVIGK